MNNEQIHSKLDNLFDIIKANIESDPDKARDLILHCLDLMKVNFNTIKQINK